MINEAETGKKIVKIADASTGKEIVRIVDATSGRVIYEKTEDYEEEQQDSD